MPLQLLSGVLVLWRDDQLLQYVDLAGQADNTLHP